MRSLMPLYPTHSSWNGALGFQPWATHSTICSIYEMSTHARSWNGWRNSRTSTWKSWNSAIFNGRHHASLLRRMFVCNRLPSLTGGSLIGCTTVDYFRPGFVLKSHTWKLCALQSSIISSRKKISRNSLHETPFVSAKNVHNSKFLSVCIITGSNASLVQIPDRALYQARLFLFLSQKY